MDGGSIKGIVLPLLLVGAAVLGGLSTLLYLLQDRLIFYRQPLPSGVQRMIENLPGTVALEVAAPDGIRLHGWLRHGAGPPPRGLVIYFGGNAEEVSGQILDAAQFAPWSLAAFNYRGYGRSEGDPSEAALSADALTLYDRLATHEEVDAARIVVLGRSLGAAVAVQLARSRPVRAVILVSPFDSLRSIARRTYPFVPVSLLLRHPFDSLALAPQIAAPLLVLAGEDDGIIPPAHSRRLFEAWAGPRRFELIPRAGHNDLHAAARYPHAIREFLASLAPAPLERGRATAPSPGQGTPRRTSGTERP